MSISGFHLFGTRRNSNVSKIFLFYHFNFLNRNFTINTLKTQILPDIKVSDWLNMGGNALI